MTEEEAKTKTCWRTLNRVVVLPESHTVELKPSTCIGSACMAWRSLGRYLQPGEGLQPGESYPLGGYCGLAGKP